MKSVRWLSMLLVSIIATSTIAQDNPAPTASAAADPNAPGAVPNSDATRIPLPDPSGDAATQAAAAATAVPEMFLNITDPLATSFVAEPGGGFMNKTDPLATFGGPVVIGASAVSSGGGSLQTQSAGASASPFLDPTANLATPGALKIQATSGGTQKLIQIKVRVVDVNRTDSFQAASALDYIASNGGSPSLAQGNNINGNLRNLTSGSRFPALVGSATNPLLGLNAAGTALGAPGSGMLVNLTGKHLNLVASILATDLNGDIVTAPQVTTLDGQNVEFVAGSQQPFQLGQSIVGPANSSVQNFFYKHIGSYISVTPTYDAANDQIQLKVVIRLSSAGTSAVSLPAAGGGFTAATVPTESGVRAISNIVNVRNGYGLVMGGLIGEQEVETVSKVPVIGDVPWLGALFRSKQTGREKTETLIFIEAQVLNDDSSIAWAETMSDFHLGQDYVNSSDMFDTNLECGLFRAGIGNYLPPLKIGEECYWERLNRTIRRQATHIDDFTK